MHDELNQKISQLLDNELAPEEALKLLEQMQLQPDLQEKLSRYEAISHALTNEEFLMPRVDFVSRISQQIQQEPAYLLPQRKRFNAPAPAKAIALAASFAAVAVLASWQFFQGSPNPSPAQPLTLAKLPPQVTAPPPAQSAKSGDKVPLNERINDYLQAHNNSVYTNGEAQFKPYTQVTAYDNRE